MQRAVAIVRNPRLLWRLVAALGALALVCGLFGGWLADRSTSPAVRLERARDLAFARKPDAAMREVRRALAELGENGDRDLRLEALSRAAQVIDFQMSDAHVQEALTFYKRIEAEFPGTQQAFDAGVRIAEILRQRLGDDLHAENQFLAVVNAFSKQAGVEKLLVRAAQIAIDHRRFEEAKTYATRVVMEYPTSDQAPEAQFIMGESLHLMGRHAEAAKAYQVIGERWPRTEISGRALFEAGNCLAEDGDLTHAIARYIESLPDHPDPLTVQRNLERVRKRFTALQVSVGEMTKEAAFDYRRFSER